MESVRAGCDMLHYFVMILLFCPNPSFRSVYLLRRNKTWFRACGEMEKGYGSSLFASYWWDSFFFILAFIS